MQVIPFTIKFFEMLGIRMYKENYLSDITYSLIESSDSFKKFFLRFITGNSQPFTKVYKQLYREFPLREDSRPDFYFEFDDEVILLENKIWDHDYHFEKYTDALDVYLSNKSNMNKTKVLISAHKLGLENKNLAINNGFDVRYWNEFVKELKENITLFSNEKELIEGYIKYIEEVIKVPVVGLINLKGDTLKSIIYLGNLIETIIKQNNGSIDFEYEIDRQNKRCKDNNSTGHGYTIKKNDKTAFVSFYLQYEYKGIPAVMIELPLDWNRELNEKITVTLNSRNSFNFEEANKVDGCAFILKEELYNKFLDSTQEEQKRILTEFYLEVNKVIEEFII